MMEALSCLVLVQVDDKCINKVYIELGLGLV